MGKYDPLAEGLRARRTKTWRASFEEIEALLKAPLPKSAREREAWWANEAEGSSHVQARAWLDAGWETANLDLAGRKVTFRRREEAASEDAAAADSPETERTTAEPAESPQEAPELAEPAQDLAEAPVEVAREAAHAVSEAAADAGEKVKAAATSTAGRSKSLFGRLADLFRGR